MAELIGMPRAAWRRQPSGRVTASNFWRSRGLVALFQFYPTLIDVIDPASTRATIATFGTPTTGVSRYGFGLKTTTNSGYKAEYQIPLCADAETHIGLVNITARTVYGAVFTRADQTGATNKLSFQYGNYDLPGIYVGNDPYPSGFNPLNAGFFIFGLSGSTGSYVRLYIDGKLNLNPSVYTPALTAARMVFLGEREATSTYATQGDYVVHATFNTILSHAEHAEIVSNVWQLFAPDPPRFYLIPSSGGVITLIVQNASHGHAVESPSLTQAHVLALAESLHGQTVESPLLSQAYALTLAAAAHAHTVDAPGLTQAHSLSVAEASHPHSADNVSLFQAHILNLSDALHEHSVEAPVLAMAGSLLIDESYHGQTAEVPSLTQAHTITVQEASHGHSVEGLTLTQAYVLVPADSTHGHSSEAPTLSTELNLLVADALHSHTVDAPGLTQAHALSLADSLHGHSAEAVSMGQGYSLIVADASHNHSAESPTVSVAFVLAIQDALHSQAADQLALTTHITLIVSDTLHAHLAGTASEITLPTGDRIFLVAHEDRLFLVATEDRLFGV